MSIMKPRLEDPDLIRLDIIRSMKFEIMKVSIALLSSCPFGVQWAPNGPVKLYWSKQASECCRTGSVFHDRKPPQTETVNTTTTAFCLSSWRTEGTTRWTVGWINEWSVFCTSLGRNCISTGLIPNNFTFLYFTFSRETLQDLYNTHIKRRSIVEKRSCQPGGPFAVKPKGNRCVFMWY